MEGRKLSVLALLLAVGCLSAHPLPRFCGFELGQRLDVLDAEVRQSYGLGSPALVVEEKDKFTYRQCDSVAPKYGFDSYSIDVTMDGTVFGISADLKCADKAEAEKRKGEIVEDLKKKFGSRISENGHITLSVASGDTYVEVDMKSTSFKRQK